MAYKRTAMLDALTHEAPEWLASDTLEADLVIMIRVAESYRLGLAAVARNALGYPTAKSAEAAKAARKAVFETSELVENVLVHLPARELFRNQRVCKSFKNAIAQSGQIRDKLFLRQKLNEPVFKMIVYGYQQTAAVLNPFFTPTKSTSVAVDQQALQTLAERASSDPVNGVTLTHPARINPKSSLMRTFLTDTACKLKAVSFELSVMDCEPYIFVGLDNLVVHGTWTIGDIFQEVLSKQCYMLIMSEQAAEEHREQREWSGTWWTSSSNAWADPDVPTLDARPAVLKAPMRQLRFSMTKVWCFKMQGPPRMLLDDLEEVHDGSEISIRPAQGPMFWLKDIVIPSPQEWADLKAKKALKN